MAQFFTDWREYGTNAAPTDWTRIWRDSDLPSITVIEGQNGKKLLRFAQGAVSGRAGASWDDIPADEELQEVLALIELDPAPAGTNVFFGVGVCCSGTGSTATGYVAWLNGAAQPVLSLQKFVNGGALTGVTGLSGSGFTGTDRATLYWIRLQADAAGVRARAWNFGDPEPTTWNLNSTDTGFRTGKPAVAYNSQFMQAGTNYVHRFGTGTEGDPALGSFPPSAPALPFPADGDTVKGVVAIPIGASTDEDGDTLQYEIDISEDGGQSFAPLFPLSEDLVRLWDVSAHPLGPNRQLRARAFDGLNYGPYGFSGIFETVENQIPDRPTVTAAVLGRGTARLSGSAFSDADQGDVHIATRYRILDSQNNVVRDVTVNNPVELTSKVFSGLQAGQYVGEMSYLSSDGTTSPPGVAVFVLQGVTQINWEDCDDA